MKVGIVVPHIFMHGEILPRVIFSPAHLSIGLADGLNALGVETKLFTPGPVNTGSGNINADLSLFENELQLRGDTYLDLLRKHPLTFVSLARQVQSELIAKAFDMANRGELDVVHIYTNEEDIALPFTKFCKKPVVFTHHDPFNFLVKYKSVFPKYKDLNWLSLSMSQRKGMPADTNWVGNIYHGLDKNAFKPNYNPKGEYIAYLGRIVEPKGVHLAIAAVKQHNKQNKTDYKLKIAGKHYAGHKKDTYWQRHILPQIDGDEIQYTGFIKEKEALQEFLGNAAALIIPSTFEEPFGMVMIEAMACGTPIVGVDSGAIPEVVSNGKTGFIVSHDTTNVAATIESLARTIKDVQKIDRKACRKEFETRFTLDRMCQEYLDVYKSLVTSKE